MNESRRKKGFVKKLLHVMFAVSMVIIALTLPQMAEKVFADNTVEVSTLGELQTALSADTVNTVIVRNAIELPNKTTLDGHGKTVQVVVPYLEESGVVSAKPSGYNVFTIDKEASVAIKNMIILGGNNTFCAGGIVSKGTLTLDNVTIARSNRGLYISSSGKAILKDSNIVRNQCTNGGGILCEGGTLVTDGCSLTENRSTGTMGGGGAMEINGSNGKLYANNTVIANNSSSEIGGAINIYGSQVYLMNCQVIGNVTTSSATSSANSGGGLGINGGTSKAVNTIFKDNYSIQSGTGTPVASDVGIYSPGTVELINCIYGTIQGSGSAVSTTNCKQSTADIFTDYHNGGVLYGDSNKYTIGFSHPTLIAKEGNPYALYANSKQNGEAYSEGVDTYFDYSNLSDVRMSYSAGESISNMTENGADASKKVIACFEGGERKSGVIGASGSSGGSLYTVKLSEIPLNGTVEGIYIYGVSYKEGTPVTVSAVPDTGYGFKGWKRNGTTVPSDASYNFNVTENVVLTAEFESLTISSVSYTEPTVKASGSITTSVTGIPFDAKYEGTISWDPTGDTFGYNTVYTATVTLTAKANCNFAENVTFPDGWTKDAASTTTSLVLKKTYSATAKAKITSVTAPTVTTQITNETEQKKVLPQTVKVAVEGSSGPISMAIEWTLKDGTQYSTDSEAENVFVWTVPEREYKNYDRDNLSLTGQVTIRNPKHTHDWQYSANGAVLFAKCSKGGTEGCVYDEVHKVSLTLSASSSNYSGSAATITIGTLEERSAWEGAGLTVPTTISYQKSDGTDLTSAPTTAGEYVAKVSPDGQTPSEANTAQVSFEIINLPSYPSEPEKEEFIKDTELAPEAPISNISFNNEKEELLKAPDIFTESEKQAIENGRGARLWIEVTDVEEKKISSEDKSKVETAVKESGGEVSKLIYFDAALYKQVSGGPKTQIFEPGIMINVTIKIPEELINKDEGIQREYKMIRLHEDKATGETIVEIIEGTFNAETNEFTYQTDKFSVYAIAYKDVSVESGKPDDSDKPAAPDNPVTPTPGTADQQFQNSLEMDAKLKVSQTQNQINIEWGKVSGADGYNVYATYCGQSYTKKSLSQVKKGSITKITLKKIEGQKLNLKKNYKIYVEAYKNVNGKKLVLGKTITAHIVGRENTSYTNAKDIKLEKNAFILKKGKKATIKAKTILVDKSKKQLSDAHGKEFRYETSNKKVAKVNANGKVEAVGKGTCYIYVYARNGYTKKVKVTVK